MKLLKSHRTIRKYQSTEIPNEVLHTILESGIRSSNTGNMQLYSIVVTRNPEKKTRLLPLHFNQPMVVEAPVLLTICFDLNRFMKWCELNQTATDFLNLQGLMTVTIDASILAQSMCIAAEHAGLGICYLGTTLYNAPEISLVLNLPSGVIPVTTLTMGYPDVVPELTDRLPLESVVHYEEYRDYPADKISEYYSFKENLESSKQFVKENKKENLAQVYAEVRYKSADNHYFSAKLLKMLRGQGFHFD